MIAAIELGKNYAQVCVKIKSFQEPESVSEIVGAENYQILLTLNQEDERDLQEIFRSLWKKLVSYRDLEPLECLVFCLEDNSEKKRRMLQRIVQLYHIPEEMVYFMGKQECFSTYVLHQGRELFVHEVLLMENDGEKQSKFLLHKRRGTMPVVTEVKNISESSLKEIVEEHMLSAVYLVGEGFTEEWIERHQTFLRKGKRIFLGKNLYVKGACYRGMDLLRDSRDYIYFGEEKLTCNVALKAAVEGRETLIPIVEGGHSWYESTAEVEVLLLDEPELEIVLIPIDGSERKSVFLHLEGLPVRPSKATRLRVSLEFTDSCHMKFMITDLGFGEFFPQSGMVYEGGLQWEQ